MDYNAKKLKCPVCGGELNAGSIRPATLVIDPDRDPDPWYVHVFYCQKSDAHNFCILEKRMKECDT
jgi:multisubunit Na+/H+ antiporter MnhE subunit